ncbi:hypothetical protein ACH5RR_000199 [Cinchona calisaya]|uniref:Glycosyl transferase CAP10 domain-containing protein n=1 Tax=Cinchona calisaya TaxID=153742 RepID=A0ABD3B0F0_9GENT
MMNSFWLRPAYQKHSRGTKWLKLNKTLTITTRVLLFLFFFALLLVSVLIFGGWINLGNYSAGKFFDRTPILPPPEFPLDCVAWDHNKTCPNNYPIKYEPTNHHPSSTCPDYFRWIHEDLKHWKGTGVTRDMVERARESAHFRLVILHGKVYVEKFVESIPNRESFTMWGILQLLRLYPGRLPDLELMFDNDDRPVIASKDYRGPNAAAPPLFRYCSDQWNLDIVFPDWTFWGWPETNIKPWRSILKDIKEGNNKTKWRDRVPYAYWRGNPDVASWRGDLMTCNVTDKDDWNTHLYVQNWEEEVRTGFKQSNIADQCTHRYKIYIEGYGWSVSEKYIFACDSPVLLMTPPRFHDFFIRGMVPQRHYWPVKDNDKCRSLKFAVEYGNNHTEKAEEIGAAGSHFIHEDMKMEYVYDYIFHLLNEYGKLLKFKPTIPPNAIEFCAESVACPAEEIWRKSMEESLEKSPRNMLPCTLPPSYDLDELKALNDEKFMLTKQVEKWENEYWKNNLTKNQ